MPCYWCCCPDEGLITEEYTLLYPAIWTPCILYCIDALEILMLLTMSIDVVCFTLTFTFTLSNVLRCLKLFDVRERERFTIKNRAGSRLQIINARLTRDFSLHFKYHRANHQSINQSTSFVPMDLARKDRVHGSRSKLVSQSRLIACKLDPSLTGTGLAHLRCV